MSFTVGETVGPYLLIGQLGQGGMATVYKAYHPALDRYVAIKALHPAFTLEPNFQARFRREAQVVARLEHPNIVPIYDYAEHEGRPYLVMKFIEGETLKARLSRGPLSKEEMTHVVISVGAALDHAHKQGILHRDIKPSNVLLANDGRIYLADFGLARIAQAGESTISSDVMLGTPQYISPEQAMGQRDLDAGTDIYSFGVLLYELLVGKVPYNADTPYSIIHDHIYAPLPLPRSSKPEIPEAIERVVLKALAKNRADRFEDVASMVEAWKQAAQVYIDPQSFAPVEVAEKSKAATLVLEAEPPSAVLESQPSVPEVPSPSEEAAVMAQLEPSQPASVQPLAAEAAAVGVVESASVAPKKVRSRKWLWAVGILASLCVCLFVLSALFSRQAGKLKVTGVTLTATSQAVTAAAATALTPAEASPTPGETPTLDLFLEATNPPPSTDQLAAARQRVEANPTDPSAHLNLAAVYFDAGMITDAESELNLAIQNGKGDVDFFTQAGDLFMKRRYYVPAARMYLGAVRLSPDPLPSDLTTRLNQALYMGSSDNLFIPMLNKMPLDRVDPQMIQVARARNALYRGNLASSEEIDSNLVEKKSDLQELKLLEAEILLKTGDKDGAKAKLQGLLDDPQTPGWIRTLAEIFLLEANR